MSALITILISLPPFVLFGQLVLLLPELLVAVYVPAAGNVKKLTVKFKVAPLKFVADVKVMKVEVGGFNIEAVQPPIEISVTEETAKPDGNSIRIHLVLV